jgi:outer membrane protein
MKSRIFPAIILGIWLFFGVGSTVQASAAATAAVGFVDFIYLVDHHPDTVQANATLKANQDAAKQEFATKSAGLDDQEKQDLDRQLGQQLEQKRLELVKPISAKVVAAANEVAKEKGLSIVIGKNDVVCGGVDITADVLKKITEK